MPILPYLTAHFASKLLIAFKSLFAQNFASKFLSRPTEDILASTEKRLYVSTYSLAVYWGSPSLHTQVTDFVLFKHGE